MAQAPIIHLSDEQWRERLINWKASVRGLCRRVRASLGLTLDSLSPGDLNSKRIEPIGPNPLTPVVFTLNDSPSHLDRRSALSLSCKPIMQALMDQDLRRVPSELEIESECVTIVDLSRSLLTGSLGHMLEDSPRSWTLESPADTKVAALVALTGGIQALAEGLGLGLRVIFVRAGGRHVEVLKERRPRAFANRVLDRLEAHLVEMMVELPQAWQIHEPQQTLATGLQSVLRDVRGRGAVAIISDFLEPAGSFAPSLLDVMNRHRITLCDLAARDSDVALHKREHGLQDANNPVFEAVRHLELPLQALPNTPLVCAAWDKEVSDNRRRIQSLLRGRAAMESYMLQPASFRVLWRRLQTQVRQLCRK